MPTVAPAPSRVVFVGPRRRYHAQHSGYECLIRYLDPGPTSNVRIPPALESGSAAISGLLKESWRSRLLGLAGSRWYGRRRVIEELSLAPTLLFSRRAVVHHLYGEESYRFSGYAPRLRGSALVATFHQPPSDFAELVGRTAHLARLDGAIAMATSQLELLRSAVGPERVTCVPHRASIRNFSRLPIPRRIPSEPSSSATGSATSSPSGT